MAKKDLTLLAKKAVETFIKKNEIIFPPDDLPKEFLNQGAGTFVTIEKNGKLRGCIGTYLPTKENIAQEVIQNAIAAATQDYRFGKINEDELPYLSYTVYILNKPKLIKSIEELDPKKYGVIVKSLPAAKGNFIFKTGLLLPGLEDVNTIDEQISIACQKAGINPNKEKFLIYKFTVKKYQ